MKSNQGARLGSRLPRSAIFPACGTSSAVPLPGIVEQADFIRAIEAPVVIDHMARVDIREGLL